MMNHCRKSAAVKSAVGGDAAGDRCWKAAVPNGGREKTRCLLLCEVFQKKIMSS